MCRCTHSKPDRSDHSELNLPQQYWLPEWCHQHDWWQLGSQWKHLHWQLRTSGGCAMIHGRCSEMCQCANAACESCTGLPPSSCPLRTDAAPWAKSLLLLQHQLLFAVEAMVFNSRFQPVKIAGCLFLALPVHALLVHALCCHLSKDMGMAN